MKNIFRVMMVAALVLGMAACGDKDNDKDNNQTDTDSGATDATLKTGTIGNGTITINDYTEENVFGVDFNKDGILEFRISGDGTDYVYLTYDYASGNNIVNKAEQWDYIDPLGTEVVIGPNSRFEGQGDAAFEDIPSLPSLFFIGCRFNLSDGVHYGWIKAHNTNGQIVWDECVYRTTPGASITTGKN